MTSRTCRLPLASVVGAATRSPQRSPCRQRIGAPAWPQSATTVKITSPARPHGHFGQSPHRRAAVHTAPETTLKPIRFYVDNVLLGVDSDGPPYAVEWTGREPARTARDRGRGRRRARPDRARRGRAEAVRDRRRDRAPAACCSKRASTTRPGSSSAGWRVRSFTVTEDGVRRKSTSSIRRLCRRRSRCSSTAARACRAGSTSFATRRRASFSICGPKDQVLVGRPFSRLGVADRARRATERPSSRAVGHVGSRRRHGDSRQPRRSGGEAADHAEPVRNRTAHRRLRREQRHDARGGAGWRSRRRGSPSRRRHRRDRGHLAEGRTAAEADRARDGRPGVLPARRGHRRRARAPRRGRAEPVSRHVHAEQSGCRRRLAIGEGDWPDPGYKVRTRDGYLAPKPPPVHPELEFTHHRCRCSGSSI